MKFPPLSAWSCYYNNGKQNSYDVVVDGIKYFIDPQTNNTGKLLGYSLTVFGYPNTGGHAAILKDGSVTTTIRPASFASATSAAKTAREVHAKRNA